MRIPGGIGAVGAPAGAEGDGFLPGREAGGRGLHAALDAHGALLGEARGDVLYHDALGARGMRGGVRHSDAPAERVADDGKGVQPKLGRQALHAYRLRFVHPAIGKEMAFEAPPPPDFTAAVERARAQGPARDRRKGRHR